MEDEYITVKEFAKQANITTQRVYQLLAKDLQNYCKVVGNTKYINKSALIDFKKLKNDDTLQVQVQALQNQCNYLQQQIEFLQQQITTKDNQITALQESLKSTTSALNAQQVLHAQTVQALEDKQTKKKHFWQRNKG